MTGDMIGSVTSALIAITVIVGSGIAHVEHYWGSDPEVYSCTLPVLNAECPPNVTFAAVAFPVHMCEPRGYIMCSNGEAVAVSKCGTNERFNNVTGWCDLATNVPLHPSCANNRTNKRYPVSCSETGATFVAVNSTCKKYVWCLQLGVNYTMDCPSLSYFIREHERCMPITEPYLIEIPPLAIAECHAKDPYVLNRTRS